MKKHYSKRDALETLSLFLGVCAAVLTLITQTQGFLSSFDHASLILLVICVASLAIYFGNLARERKGNARLLGIAITLLVIVIGGLVWRRYIYIPRQANDYIIMGDMALSEHMPQTAKREYQKALECAPDRRLILNRITLAEKQLENNQEDLR